MAAKGHRIGGEIRIAQGGGGDAAGIVALLMHADRAIHAVVDDHHDDRQIILHGGGEFLPVHQKAAVARKADDHAFGMHALGAHGGGQAIAHGARHRGELCGILTKAHEAPHPDRVIARAICHDGVAGQTLAQP